MRGSAVMAVSVLLLAAQAGARAEAHDWYGDLHTTEGRSCCGNQDCRPVEYRYSTDQGHQIRIGDQWFSVSPGTILPVSSPDGRTHACYLDPDGNGKRPIILCVILPGTA